MKSPLLQRDYAPNYNILKFAAVTHTHTTRTLSHTHTTHTHNTHHTHTHTHTHHTTINIYHLKQLYFTYASSNVALAHLKKYRQNINIEI